VRGGAAVSDYVWMRRPDLPDVAPAQAPRAAFEAVHRHQGWVECDEPPEPTQADLDAAVAGKPPPPPEPAEPDTPVKSGERSAARGEAGSSKDKE